MFGCLYQKYKINKKIRLIELFAGVGSQAMALRNLDIEFEHYKVVEFDKYAIKSYNAIHDTNFDTSDIREIHGIDLDITNKDKFEYILTYSFPCVDISKSGKQKGMSKGKNTRSGLLWQVERILDELNETDQLHLPQILLMENVPDVIGKKNYKDFMEWYSKLEKLGYQSYYKILNAKDYGIPQNRERCFMVSILGYYSYEWPKPVPLELRLKDLLESQVDERFYVSDEKIKYMRTTFCDQDYKDPKCVVVGEADFGSYESLNMIYDTRGLSPTLNTMQGGHRQPKILEPVICASRGRNPVNPKSRKSGEPTEQMLEINTSGCSNALTTVQKDNYVLEPKGIAIDDVEAQDLVDENRFYKQAIETLINNECKDGDTMNAYNKIVDNSGISPTLTTRPDGFKTAILPIVNNCRVRKLTPLECWRLMGFKDDDFYKAQKVNSNSQLYKQAGNSIVVNVLMAIFKQLI